MTPHFRADDEELGHWIWEPTLHPATGITQKSPTEKDKGILVQASAGFPLIFSHGLLIWPAQADSGQI